jgi:hypothetical protein
MLREWMIRYVQHKDLLRKQLARIEEQGERVIFHFKGYTLTGVAMDRLEWPGAQGKVLIVVPNTKDNHDILIKRFTEFSRQNVTIVFVNTKTDDRWAIIPSTHAMIADTNLAEGIRSLAAAVPLC